MNFTSKNIFLIDGIGAILTAVLLSQVLTRFEQLFGMPPDILWWLASIAFCFSIYSLLNHFFSFGNRGLLLKGIMLANLGYCLLTFALVMINFKTLTWLGISYFIGEIFIITFLIIHENRILKSI